MAETSFKESPVPTPTPPQAPALRLLDAPIKELGSRQVSVSFTRNVKATVTVEVVPEGKEEA